ncbi:hypothetical protein ACFYNY_25005 [Streptomyces sp. NPDC006530]|uniref:hypothetical protein n=1 Tax=Streptomyces sp. NPDC006530 TaxID=3364750 RepID=UPI0036847819
MNHTRTVVLAAAGLLLAGCGSSPEPVPAKTVGVASPGTACTGKKWPQSVPPVMGTPLADAIDGPLLCFNITAAVAPDGHDALQDPANDTDWIVTGTKPAAGTNVTEDQPVTLLLSNPDQ